MTDHLHGPRNTREPTSSTTKEWKLLFVNGCENKRPFPLQRNAKVTQMHHADKQRYYGAMITALDLGMTFGVIGTTLKDVAYLTSTQTKKQAYSLVMEHGD